MHNEIVSSCSPNNNMHCVCNKYIVKKLPDGFFSFTAYVTMQERALVDFYIKYWNLLCEAHKMFDNCSVLLP